MVNAILYLATAGCQWRQLPKDFPPYTTVQNYFYRWSRVGTWVRITKCGDRMVRGLLSEATNVLLTRVSRWNWLKSWGFQVAKRRGKLRARVAVARRLAVIMYRMWMDGTEFRARHDNGTVVTA